MTSLRRSMCVIQYQHIFIFNLHEDDISQKCWEIEGSESPADFFQVSN